MTVSTDDIISLKSLPCFNDIIDISPITAGLSHSCFKVITSRHSFFAKKLCRKTAKIELDSSANTAQVGLSPTIIYHNTDWLVTEFINGTTLDKVNMCINDKFSVALALMTKLHTLSPQVNTHNLNPLNTLTLTKSLFSHCESLDLAQRATLENIGHMLTITLQREQKRSGSPDVLCHGDINYSNIMIEYKGPKSNKADTFLYGRSWLLDFECAQLAPVEFDLAMFIAVNNISFELKDQVIVNYVKQLPEFIPNYRLLDTYILYSFFINALWYFTHGININTKAQFKPLVIEQCSAFDNFAAKQGTLFPSLMATLTYTK